MVMIKFYGREKELSVIESWYEAVQKGTLFTVIIGRRRIGKTRLWIEASRNKAGWDLRVFLAMS